jgi:hypothetical protein
LVRAARSLVVALLAVRFVDEFAGFLPHGAFESFPPISA